MNAITPLPRVSLVIPVFNEEGVIERCLRAALNQTVPAHEIIVVDNRSTDTSAERVQRMAAAPGGSSIRLISQDAEQGLVPTRNAGFEAATGDVCGRIDADSIVDRSWVENLSHRMTDPSVDAVTGPVSYYDLPFTAAAGAADDITRRTLRRLGHRYPFLYGSNMALRREAWNAIRDIACLDHEDQMHEDIDLSVHLAQAGLKVDYLPGMRAGVSARRMTNSPSEFLDYTRRFERTYANHRIQHWYLQVPQRMLQAIYWPVHAAQTLGIGAAFKPSPMRVAA
jgi:cellulose synthase/poly-beta-1,6-N-acetylglucosamine synthase-like glycosyltransferase